MCVCVRDAECWPYECLMQRAEEDDDHEGEAGFANTLNLQTARAEQHRKQKAHKLTQLSAPSLQADHGPDFKTDEE